MKWNWFVEEVQNGNTLLNKNACWSSLKRRRAITDNWVGTQMEEGWKVAATCSPLRGAYLHIMCTSPTELNVGDVTRTYGLLWVKRRINIHWIHWTKRAKDRLLSWSTHSTYLVATEGSSGVQDRFRILHNVVSRHLRIRLNAISKASGAVANLLSSTILHLACTGEWAGNVYKECHVAGMFFASIPHTHGFNRWWIRSQMRMEKQAWPTWAQHRTRAICGE